MGSIPHLSSIMGAYVEIPLTAVHVRFESLWIKKMFYESSREGAKPVIRHGDSYSMYGNFTIEISTVSSNRLTVTSPKR